MTRVDDGGVLRSRKGIVILWCRNSLRQDLSHSGEHFVTLCHFHYRLVTLCVTLCHAQFYIQCLLLHIFGRNSQFWKLINTTLNIPFIWWFLSVLTCCSSRSQLLQLSRWRCSLIFPASSVCSQTSLDVEMYKRAIVEINQLKTDVQIHKYTNCNYSDTKILRIRFLKTCSRNNTVVSNVQPLCTQIYQPAIVCPQAGAHIPLL